MLALLEAFPLGSSLPGLPKVPRRLASAVNDGTMVTKHRINPSPRRLKSCRATGRITQDVNGDVVRRP